MISPFWLTLGSVVRSLPGNGAMFEKAAAELEPDVRLLKLNADDEQNISAEFGFPAFPLCSCSKAAILSREQREQWIRCVS